MALTWCISLSAIHTTTQRAHAFPSWAAAQPCFLTGMNRKLGNDSDREAGHSRDGEPAACALGHGVKDTGETEFSGDLAKQLSQAPPAGRDPGSLGPQKAFLLLENKQQCLRLRRGPPATTNSSSTAATIPPASHQAMVYPNPCWGHRLVGPALGVQTCKPHLQGLVHVSQARPLPPGSADKKQLAKIGGHPARLPVITPGAHSLY